MSDQFVVYYIFMKKTILFGQLAAVLSAVLIAGTSMVALGDPTFAFSATGPNTVELTAVSLTGGVSLAVPSQDGGKVVESIAANAFSLCVNTEEISIPASVMTIAPTAFDGCVSLTDILVEDGSTSYSDRDGVLCDGTGEILILCPAS
ncbi:MAG: leucine-rich repeat protein, partial [Victivallales bacterium]|nr:leucine-rich repeat protein [Victivallales bacterium]